MKAALKKQIDWEVNREELTLRGEKSNHYALIRNDNGEILSVCSSKYEPFYNRDLLQLVARIEGLSNFECIGFEQFQKGKRILAFLKDRRPSLLVGEACEHYLILGNSHDQTSKIFMGLSNFMFRCENQFSRELYTLRMKHCQRLVMSDQEIVDMLAHYERSKQQQLLYSRQLSKIAIGRGDVDEFLHHLFPERPSIADTHNNFGQGAYDQSKSRRNALMESIDREMDGLGKNAWGMFNGVTYYTSNRMRSRNSGFGNTNGTAQQLNARAWEYCKRMLRSANKPSIYNLSQRKIKFKMMYFNDLAFILKII